MCSAASTTTAVPEDEGEDESDSASARGLLEALQKATGTWIPYSVDAHAGKYWLLCMSTRHDVPWIGTLKLRLGAPEKVWPFRVSDNVSGCFCILKTSRDHATLTKRMRPTGLGLAVRLKSSFAQENALFVYLRERGLLLVADGTGIMSSSSGAQRPPPPSVPPLLVPPAAAADQFEDLRRKLRERDQDLAKMQSALQVSEKKYEDLMHRLNDPEAQGMTLEEFNRRRLAAATPAPAPASSSPSSSTKPAAPATATRPPPPAAQVTTTTTNSTVAPRYMGGLYSQPRSAYLDAELSSSQQQKQRSQKRHMLLMDWKS